MKKIVFLLSVTLGLGYSSAQVLNEKGLYVNDEGELITGVISTIKNHQKIDLTIKDGVINGEATYYYASSDKMETGTFINGQRDLKWTRYNENGSISAIAFYAQGKKTGTWLVFDDKGNKRFEMNYNNGEKVGVWTNWNEDGIASTKDYSKVN